LTCESCDFTRLNCLIYIKIGKYGKEIGEKLGNYEQNRNSHKVNSFYLDYPLPLAPKLFLPRSFPSQTNSFSGSLEFEIEERVHTASAPDLTQ